MYRNYLFDLYGTLIDIHTDETPAGLWRQMAGIYARRGADYSPKELHAAYLRICAEEIEKKREETGSRWPEPDIGVVFRRLYLEAPKHHAAGLEIGDAVIQMTADAFRTLSMKRLKLYPHTAAVLKKLREQGKHLYLLSNAQNLFTIPELEQLGILPLFEAVYISSDRGVKKPDPAFMEMLLQEQNLDPAECLMIGNDLDTDMESAARCGVRGVFLNTYNVPLEEVKKWKEDLTAEGITLDIQLAMTGDIRVLLRRSQDA
ncbi:MAG: HAD family hydrolase [Lachnospiraceae bacterium]|jgi:putative hydrolase of the HAD superfamily